MRCVCVSIIGPLWGDNRDRLATTTAAVRQLSQPLWRNGGIFLKNFNELVNTSVSTIFEIVDGNKELLFVKRKKKETPRDLRLICWILWFVQLWYRITQYNQGRDNPLNSLAIPHNFSSSYLSLLNRLSRKIFNKNFLSNVCTNVYISWLLV